MLTTFYSVMPETQYHVEAFGPVLHSELERLLVKIDPRGIRRKLKLLVPHQIERAGKLIYPIVPVMELFNPVPGALLDLLYGQPLWADNFHNIVVTTGLTDLIDKYFKGSTYTAAHYVGLTSSSPSVVAGDTMASHGGWTEVTAYSQANRVTPTWGTTTAGSLDNSASKAQFSINGTATVGGAFLTTNNTKGGTTGTLYGGGAFSEGNRSLVNGDTLNVQMTVSAS
jgi:hypothetical protein